MLTQLSCTLLVVERRTSVLIQQAVRIRIHLGVNNDIFYLAHGSKYILCTADLSDLLTLSDLLWARYHFGVGVNLSWQSCIHCWSSFSLSRGLRTGLSCGVGSCGTELSSCRHKRFDMFNLVV